MKCANCLENHPAYSKSCTKYLRAKEIKNVQIDNRVTKSQARKIVQSREEEFEYGMDAPAPENISRNSRHENYRKYDIVSIINTSLLQLFKKSGSGPGFLKASTGTELYLKNHPEFQPDRYSFDP